MYETDRLQLKHPVFSYWEGMYRNLWCHRESAEFMLWNVTTSPEEAQERMRRSIAFQEGKPAWFVYEKCSGEPMGFAGFREIEPGVFEDTGIAVGPAFVGKGYGKEILNLLTRIAKEEYGAVGFIASCRSCGQKMRWYRRSDGTAKAPESEKKAEEENAFSFHMENGEIVMKSE